jgi:hypothetical protein
VEGLVTVYEAFIPSGYAFVTGGSRFGLDAVCCWIDEN